MSWALVWVALPILAVAALSRRLTGTPVTPAMVFVVAGVLIGPEAIDGFTAAPTGEAVRTLAEATLAVILFSDAARIKLSHLRRESGVPLRLLAIGLPGTIALGAVLAALLFGHFTIAEALVLAVTLAPTDAALGAAVVTEPRLPSPIRQGLNVESGLNDGICVPILFIVLASAEVESHVTSHHALTIIGDEIGYGVLGGVAAGLLVSAIMLVAGRRALITGAWLQVIPVAGAALAYGVAAALGGSGFIAAFLAGAIFGGLASRESEEAGRFSEEVGNLLDGVTFVVFGAVLLGPALAHLTWQIGVYAILSLTIVRMLPVAIAMVGTGARRPTIAFLGWFGPRGLASIVFAVIVVEESKLPETGTIVLATYATVGLSVLAHGISAAPLTARYVRWYESHPSDARPRMESGAAPEHRVRGQLRFIDASNAVAAAPALPPAETQDG